MIFRKYYNVLIILHERKIFSNSMTAPMNEDADVSVERRRVLKGSGKRDLIRLENLTQVHIIYNLSEINTDRFILLHSCIQI